MFIKNWLRKRKLNELNEELKYLKNLYSLNEDFIDLGKKLDLRTSEGYWAIKRLENENTDLQYKINNVKMEIEALG